MGSTELNVTEDPRYPQWVESWGGSLTQKEYENLDKTYNILSAEYMGGITPRLELALRDICLFRMKRDNALLAGNAQEAKRFSEMIDKTMASEALKVGDGKPMEKLRVDALADALEKKGLIKEGKIVGRKDLLRILNSDKKKFKTSIDVVDEIIYAIINTMRANAGESEMDALPETAQVKDECRQLLSAPTDEEKKAMKELGVIRPAREGHNPNAV